MALFRKKSDPIAQSQEALERRLAALQQEIRALNQNLAAPSPPAPQSPQSPSRTPPAPQPAPRTRNRTAGPADPTFEAVDHRCVQGSPESPSTRGHYNELGVRKYDPAASIRRWIDQLRGQPPSNPKLISFLAAGSIHGLRPLRYEKRIARRRFMALFAFFLAIIWGLVYIYQKNG